MGETFEEQKPDAEPKAAEKAGEKDTAALDLAQKQGDAREEFAEQIMTIKTFLTPEHTVDRAKVEGAKDTIPANLLEQLNQLQPGLLFDLFIAEKDGVFAVDFGANTDADQYIGLSQLLRGKSKKYPEPLESIQAIDITEANGEAHETSRSGVRGNFYEKLGKRKVYQEVHSEYHFKILAKDDDYAAKVAKTDRAAEDFHAQLDSAYAQNLPWQEFPVANLEWHDGEYHYVETASMENVTQYLVREALYQDVDPQLALSIVKTSLGTTAPRDFESKFQWTLRAIKEYESHYSAEHNDSDGKDEDNVYTGEFLAGLMEFPLALDLPDVKAFFAQYSELAGKQVTVPENFSSHADDDHEWRTIETADGEGIRAIVPYAVRISSHFGFRKRPRTTSGWGTAEHKGIDIAAPKNSPIRAYAEGTVKNVVYGHKTAGNYIEVQHPNGLLTRYLHCNTVAVQEGQKITKGEVIAGVGSTGNSSGPHLHFEIRRLGIALNPERYLQRHA